MIGIVIMLAFCAGIGIGIYLPNFINTPSLEEKNTLKLNEYQREALAKLADQKARMIADESDGLYTSGVVSDDIHSSHVDEINTYKEVAQNLRKKNAISAD